MFDSQYKENVTTIRTGIKPNMIFGNISNSNGSTMTAKPSGNTVMLEAFP